MLALSVIGLAALPVIALVAGRRQRGFALALGVGLLASLALVLCFQWLGHRPRPDGVRLVLAQPVFFSYPSGHAAIAACIAALMLLAPGRNALDGIAVLLGLGVVYSRVYLGHHFPSDIAGGALLGAAVGAACHGLFMRPRRDVRWLLWPQAAVVLVVTHMAYLGHLPRDLLSWPHADKVFHFLLFGAVVFWLDLWLSPRRLFGIPLAIAVPLAWAAAEELAQQLSPRRSADVVDLLCDIAGMTVFYLLSQRSRGLLLAEAIPVRHRKSEEPAGEAGSEGTR